MDFPRMTPIESELNQYNFKVAIENVRRLKNGAPIADILMQCFNKLEHHVQALESEIEVMEGINNERTTTRSDCETIGIPEKPTSRP